LSDSLATSKSWVQQFVDRAKSAVEKAPGAHPLSYVRETGSAAGQYAMGGAIGALLGATHAKFGLDKGGMPIDGLVAAAGAIAGIALSGHAPGAAAMAIRGGSQAFAVFTFRKSFELVAKGPLAAHGGSGDAVRIGAPRRGKEDPILKTAEKLDGEVAS